MGPLTVLLQKRKTPSCSLAVKRIHSSQRALKCASSLAARIEVRACTTTADEQAFSKDIKSSNFVRTRTLAYPSDLLKTPNEGSCANPWMWKQWPMSCLLWFKNLAQRHSPQILKVELPRIDLPLLLSGLLPESH